MAKFIVLYNGEPLKTFELDNPAITIGRLPENTISIANMGVSRRHARIEEDTDRNLMLTDLNSLNGTFINGKKVKKVKLNNGDKISIGKYVIIYKNEGGAGNEGAPVSDPVMVNTAPKPALQDSNKKTEDAQERSKKVQTGLPAESAGDQSQNSQAVLIETSKHVVYKLDKPYITLGSGEADDIFVSGFMVGKGQVTIERHDDGVYISAQKLMGKLKVNGHQIKTHKLKHKDRIEVGASTFRYMENG